MVKSEYKVVDIKVVSKWGALNLDAEEIDILLNKHFRDGYILQETVPIESMGTTYNLLFIFKKSDS